MSTDMGWYFLLEKKMANVDMLGRLYRYMKEQKIDETDWSYSGGNLQDIHLCVMDGKDITDEYDYDNHFHLDPIIDMIQRTFLQEYTDSDNRGTISVGIVSDAGNKNAIKVSITRIMEDV